MVQQEKKIGIEILRVLGTLMVVAYHLMVQSTALTSTNGYNYYILIFLSQGGRLACDIFVIISASFLVNKTFKTKRVIDIWIKTFLSVVTVNFLIFVFDSNHLNDYGSFYEQFFPILRRPYWYIQCYIALIITQPILNTLVNEHKELHKHIIFVSILYIVIISLAPTQKQYMGLIVNEYVFFAALYLITGIIIKNDVKVKFPGLCALTSWSLLYLLTVFLDANKNIYEWAGKYRFYYIANFDTAFCVLISFFMFAFFRNITIDNEILKIIVSFLAKYTVYVFLIHQVPILYYENYYTSKVLYFERFYDNKLFIGYFFICVVMTFAVATFIGVIISFLLRIPLLIKMKGRCYE